MSKKAKKVDIEMIVKKNPKIDKRQLEDAFKLLKIIRDKGIKRTEYSLISPYASIVSGKSNS